MNRISAIKCAAVALLVCSGAAAWAAGTKTKVVVASDATFPPMEYVDEGKNVVGYDIDMLKAIAAAAGFDVEIKNTAWDGIFAGLASSDYNAICSSVTITDERKKTYDFTNAYINAGQVLVVPVATKGIEKLADMKGKKVGVQIGTTGDIEVAKFKDVKKATYDECGLAFEDLANGRIDGVVIDSPIATQFALQTPKYKGKLKVVGKPFTDEWFGIVVKKGDAATLKLFNDGLAKIKADGTLDKIAAKWLR